jgi:hypothetical protein
VPTYETAVEDLLVAIPEFIPQEHFLAKEDFELPHVVYGSLGSFLQDRYRTGGASDPVLKKCLDFLEGLVATDEHLASLVEVSVLEMLGDFDRGRGRRTVMVELLAQMGPKCAYLFRHVEALWTGTDAEFEKLPPDEGLREQWPPLGRS